jgi:hypothetical protein
VKKQPLALLALGLALCWISWQGLALNANALTPPTIGDETFISTPKTPEGAVLTRWKLPTTGPRIISVYIDRPDLPSRLYAEHYRAYVLQAMRQWEAAAGDRLKFQEVPQAATAEITFHWVDDLYERRRAGEAQQTFDNAGWLHHVDVRIQTWRYWGDDRPAPDSLIQETILHELGHAIGLCHSDNPQDILYGGSRHAMSRQQIEEYRPQLSKGDVSAVQQLYGATLARQVPVEAP